MISRQPLDLLLPTIAVPIGIAVVLSAGGYWTVVIVVGVLLLAVSLWLKGLKAPVYGLSIALWFLALFPNSSVIERVYESNILRPFSRYIFGIFNPWDILLFACIVLAYLGGKKIGILRNKRKATAFLFFVFLLLFFAIGNGLVRATVWPYGETTLRNLAQGSLPCIYLILTYIVAKVLIREYTDVKVILDTLYSCASVVVIVGIVLLILAFTGKVFPSTTFLGVPLILYDQMMFLSPIVGFVFVGLLLREKQSKLKWVLFCLSIFFLLLSTRRLVIIMLFVHLIAYVALTDYLTGWKIVRAGTLIRMIRPVFLAIVVFVGMSWVFVPKLGPALELAVESINIFVGVGLEYAGDSRIAEMKNMLANMEQRPESYVLGMGIGTKFFEYHPMGYIRTGDTGFSARVMEDAQRGWFPYFHLPYVSGIYRFGFVGYILMLVGAFGWWWRCILSFRRINRAYLPYAIPLSLLCVEGLLALGDSINPTYPALVGILLAIVAWFEREGRHLRGSPTKHEGGVDLPPVLMPAPGYANRSGLLTSSPDHQSENVRGG